MSKTIVEQMQARIRLRGRGSVFVAQDFFDLGSRAAIDQNLSRLAKDEILRRIARGIYSYPQTSKLLGEEVPPSPAEVAAALARKTGSRIQTTGARAANELGVSTQVPAQNVFLTDGRARRVRIGNQTVELRHAAPRRLIHAGRRESAVLQALRYLGESNITSEVIQHLRKTLTAKEKLVLSRDRRLAPSWLLPVLEQVLAEQ